MKHLKKFESYNNQEFVKKYGEYYPMTNVKIGDNILYTGTPYDVTYVDNYVMKLSNNNMKRPVTINQVIFTDNCAIVK